MYPVVGIALLSKCSNLSRSLRLRYLTRMMRGKSGVWYGPGCVISVVVGTELYHADVTAVAIPYQSLIVK